jgi:hypothetical protein
MMVVGRIVFRLHRFEDVALLTDGKFFRFGGAPSRPLTIFREKLISCTPLPCTGCSSTAIAIARISTSAEADPRNTPIFEIFEIRGGRARP